MKLLRLNSYLLRITDPLIKLMESRFHIVEGFEAEKIPPIYVLPRGASLVFSALKKYKYYG
ncbi:MAG: hypothetical protein AABX85_04710 [Nanoarchaeota archaeon]